MTWQFVGDVILVPFFRLSQIFEMEFIATAALSPSPFVHPFNQKRYETLHARNLLRLARF